MLPHILWMCRFERTKGVEQSVSKAINCVQIKGLIVNLDCLEDWEKVMKISWWDFYVYLDKRLQKYIQNNMLGCRALFVLKFIVYVFPIKFMLVCHALWLAELTEGCTARPLGNAFNIFHTIIVFYNLLSYLQKYKSHKRLLIQQSTTFFALSSQPTKPFSLTCCPQVILLIRMINIPNRNTLGT